MDSQQVDHEQFLKLQVYELLVFFLEVVEVGVRQLSIEIRQRLVVNTVQLLHEIAVDLREEQLQPVVLAVPRLNLLIEVLHGGALIFQELIDRVTQAAWDFGSLLHHSVVEQEVRIVQLIAEFILAHLSAIRSA